MGKNGDFGLLDLNSTTSRRKKLMSKLYEMQARRLSNSMDYVTAAKVTLTSC